MRKRTAVATFGNAFSNLITGSSVRTVALEEIARLATLSARGRRTVDKEVIERLDDIKKIAKSAAKGKDDWIYDHLS